MTYWPACQGLGDGTRLDTVDYGPPPRPGPLKPEPRAEVVGWLEAQGLAPRVGEDGLIRLTALGWLRALLAESAEDRAALWSKNVVVDFADEVGVGHDQVVGGFRDVGPGVRLVGTDLWSHGCDVARHFLTEGGDVRFPLRWGFLGDRAPPPAAAARAATGGRPARALSAFEADLDGDFLMEMLVFVDDGCPGDRCEVAILRAVVPGLTRGENKFGDRLWETADQRWIDGIDWVGGAAFPDARYELVGRARLGWAIQITRLGADGRRVLRGPAYRAVWRDGAWVEEPNPEGFGTLDP